MNSSFEAPYFNDPEPYLKMLQDDGLFLSSDRKSRDSKEKAYHYISRVGIQRFHNYYSDLKPLAAEFTRPFGVDDVLRLYKFDRKLRLLTLDAIERIEVATKTYLCNHLHSYYGENFLKEILQRENFSSFDFGTNEDKKNKLKRTLQGTVSNVLKSSENQHYREKHRVEIIASLDQRQIADAMTIGQVSKVFEVLKLSGKRRIARNFGANENFGLWLWRFTHIRNAAAHHARLWNIEFEKELAIPGSVHKDFRKRKLNHYAKVHYYSSAVLMFHCLKKVARRTRWHWRLHSVLDSKSLTPDSLNISFKMGFPLDWEKQEFWRGATSDVI